MTSTDGSDCGSGALPGSALMMIGSPTNGFLATAGGELRAELAVGQVQRPLVDQPERRGIPERRRAAVAEDDLVAVGHREKFAQPVADPADEVLDRGLPVRGAEQRGGAVASACSCSGRTLDGPQPKRPSLGLMLSGIVSASAMITRLVTRPSCGRRSASTATHSAHMFAARPQWRKGSSKFAIPPVLCWT